MLHTLEDEYDLSATELLDAIDERFRLKVALSGAVAEVQCAKKVKAAQDSGLLVGYEEHDQDGHPDFTLHLPDGRELKMEVKNVRDSDEAFRRKGEITGFKVETQKTRAATGDPSSRYYDAGYFDILAVCLGIKTGDYTDLFFISSEELERHTNYPHKLKSMQRVPLPESMATSPEMGLAASDWHGDLGELLSTI